MPIKHSIWTVGEKPQLLPSDQLPSEDHLEEMIVADPRILSDNWMLIGRQVITKSGGRIDLLAITPDASLVLIELKRAKTPRDVVAQAIDYATWVEGLEASHVAQIFSKFSEGENLGEAFEQRFGSPLVDDQINQSHQIVISATDTDSATERIIQYLNAKDIPINVLYFQVFKLKEQQLVSRTWFIDPSETQENALNTSKRTGQREKWNGEFYGSFGHDDNRSWEEAREYGFFSAGGGTWYSQTLKQLEPGDRVWINIPKEGYVGVGVVTEPARPASEFTLNIGGKETLALDVLTKGKYHREHIEDPEMCEWFVKLEWEAAVPFKNRFRETGFFGNQNSICRPTAKSWRHTITRLKELFKVY